LRHIVDPDPVEPGIFLGAFIDRSGRFGKRLVGLDDLAIHRRIELGSGLHRLDHADFVAHPEFLAGIPEFDEHDIAQLFGRVSGDADSGCIAFFIDRDPFVIFRVVCGHLSLRRC